MCFFGFGNLLGIFFAVQWKKFILVLLLKTKKCQLISVFCVINLLTSKEKKWWSINVRSDFQDCYKDLWISNQFLCIPGMLGLYIADVPNNFCI